MTYRVLGIYIIGNSGSVHSSYPVRRPRQGPSESRGRCPVALESPGPPCWISPTVVWKWNYEDDPNEWKWQTRGIREGKAKKETPGGWAWYE